MCSACIEWTCVCVPQFQFKDHWLLRNSSCVWCACSCGQLLNIVHSNYELIYISMQKVQSMSPGLATPLYWASIFSGWERVRTTQARWVPHNFHAVSAITKKSGGAKKCAQNSQKKVNSIDSVAFRIVHVVLFCWLESFCDLHARSTIAFKMQKNEVKIERWCWILIVNESSMNRYGDSAIKCGHLYWASVSFASS